LRLDETLWIVGGGAGKEWRAIHRRRLDGARAVLRSALAQLSNSAPVQVRRRRYGESLRFLLSAKGPRAERLLAHPALDYWMSLWEGHFSRPAAAADWHLQFGLLGGFAAALALESGKSLSCDAVLDPDGRFFFYGLPWVLEFAAASRAPVSVRVKAGALRLEGAGVRAELTLSEAAAGGPLRRLDEVVPGVIVDDRGWLQLRGVTMHGAARLADGPRRSFAEVLRRALRDMAERDPLLHAEMLDLMSVIVPLRNPVKHGSVSSSYANLRGLIALSHDEDPLLQAETMIHEFCHMKMNQLLAADALLLPGQSGQVFYSPWRPDARRLRGLLLGAHAFLNVARYLARSLQREDSPAERRVEIMTNVSRRTFQVESAMQALTAHGSFTEFGRRFVLGMCRELGLLHHAMLWFPPALIAEQKAECGRHRAAHALAGTALHKTAEFRDAVPRQRFSPKRGVK
jgi:HEXXH motif-containing protein